MAAYPTLGQLLESSEGGEDRVVLDRATNGALYGRALWPSEKRRFDPVHVVQETEAEQLRTFYVNNRALVVDFTWDRDGQVYSCLFAAPPTFRPLGGGWCRVQVTLLEA